MSEDREDEEWGEREGEDTQALFLSSGTHWIHNSLAEHAGRIKARAKDNKLHPENN